MAVVEISVTPLGTGETGVSRYVAHCVEIARSSGLEYQLTPMGSILEGNLDAILDVVREMHEAPFSQGVKRVSTLIKIDDRRDRSNHSLEGKVKSVEEKLA